MKEPKYIFFKTIDLNNDNKFDIKLRKENPVEKIKFLKRNNYLLTGLKINLKIEDKLTRWPDYKGIKKLPDQINEILKKSIL